MRKTLKKTEKIWHLTDLINLEDRKIEKENWGIFTSNQSSLFYSSERSSLASNLTKTPPTWKPLSF